MLSITAVGASRQGLRRCAAHGNKERTKVCGYFMILQAKCKKSDKQRKMIAECSEALLQALKDDCRMTRSKRKSACTRCRDQGFFSLQVRCKIFRLGLCHT